MKSIINRKFALYVISLFFIALAVIGITAKQPEGTSKIFALVLLLAIVAVLAVLVLQTTPCCYRFDNRSVEIPYALGTKTEKLLWTDIYKIDVQTEYRIKQPSFFRTYHVSPFRSYFRLWHVDENGNVDYSYIPKTRAARRYIEKYGKIEIQ